MASVFQKTAKLYVNVLARGRVLIVPVRLLIRVLATAGAKKMQIVIVLMKMILTSILEGLLASDVKNIGLVRPVICAVILAFHTKHLLLMVLILVVMDMVPVNYYRRVQQSI
jgi:hypothetical protein